MLPRFHKLMLTILALTIAPKSHTAAVPNDERALVVVPEGWPAGIAYIPGRTYPDHPSLEILETPNKGLGLFAKTDLEIGTILGEYTGELRFDNQPVNVMDLFTADAGEFVPYACTKSIHFVQKGNATPNRSVQELIKNGETKTLAMYYATKPDELSPDQLRTLLDNLRSGKLRPTKQSAWYNVSSKPGESTPWSLVIDAKNGGSVARFVNIPDSEHTEPNAHIVVDKDNPTVRALVTKRAIKAGKEITNSYGLFADQRIWASSKSGSEPKGEALIPTQALYGPQAQLAIARGKGADIMRLRLERKIAELDHQQRSISEQRKALETAIAIAKEKADQIARAETQEQQTFVRKMDELD